jgi:RNA polymerase sigma-70 factor, ECF subfamily
MGQEMPETLDADLVQEILKGDERSFAELLRRHHAVVWRTARRMLGNPTDAEDAVQEVFLRVFTSLGHYNKSYPFHSWVKRIAANHCIDQLRSRKLRRCDLLSDMTPHQQEKVLNDFRCNAGYRPFAAKDPDVHQRAVMSLVCSLKPNYRAAFVLRELAGWAYADIARELGVAETAARSRVCRAKAEVRQRLLRLLDTFSNQAPHAEALRTLQHGGIAQR